MLHGGLDLHGDNVFCSLLDGNRQVVFERCPPNELELIKQALEPYRTRIKALAVELTYNWAHAKGQENSSSFLLNTRPLLRATECESET